MRSFRHLAEVSPDLFGRPSAVTIGKFDGVHLGHHRVLAQLVAAAEARNLEPVVFTFTQNPLAVLAPERCPHPLASPEQRLEQLAQHRISATVMVDFDDSLRSLTPEAYVETVLRDALTARYVQVGQDFRFGKGGAGTVDTLTELGAANGFEIAITDDVRVAGERVSSSRIRTLLSQGDVETAARLLGRPQAVRGRVVTGAQRGRELGFPTANLAPDSEGLAPCDGVYAGWATVAGTRRMAAISIGTNPTFTPEAPVTVEAYLLDFDGDLYGQTLTLEFTHHIRGMRSFASIAELTDAMHADVRKARELLSGADRG